MSNIPPRRPLNGHGNKYNQSQHVVRPSYYHPYYPLVPSFLKKSTPKEIPQASSHDGRISSSSVDNAGGSMIDPRLFYPAEEFSYCSSLREALCELKNKDDGVSDVANKRCIVAAGTETRTKGCDKIYKYKCNRPQCTYVAQIRERCTTRGGSTFEVYKRPNTRHCHVVRKEVLCMGTVRQIPEAIQRVIDDYLLKEERENGKSIHRVTPKSILLNVLSTIRDRKALSNYRHCLSQGAFKDQLNDQLRTQVGYRRQRHVQKLLGTSKIQTQFQLQEILAIWKLKLPANYAPRSDYLSAEELANAMGLDSDSMLALDLSHGVVHERYKAIAKEQRKRSCAEYTKKMEMSFFVYSPTCLWQLLNLAKRRKGTRQITVDGTRGICQLLTTLIIVGATSVRYRHQVKGKQKVTSSLRPIAFIHAAGERFYVYIQTLYELRRLCRTIFDIEFEIDWGTSDHANAFIYAHLQFNNAPHICDDDVCKEESANPMRKEPTSLKISDGDEALLEVHDGDDSDDEVKYVPIISQFTQDENPHPPVISSNGHGEEEAMSEYVSNFPDDIKYWGDNCNHAATGCWFHVGNHVVKKDSFVGRFTDKAYIRVQKTVKGKKKRDAAPSGKLYSHLCAIHACKTDAMKITVRDLFMRFWKENKLETEAATLFRKSYGVEPYDNWNYNVTGEVGVYPSNCPSESYNHHCVKGTSSIYNLSLAVYLVEKMPAMLHDESLLRSDPCVIEIPNKCHHNCMVVNLFYKAGRDVLVLEVDDNGIANNWMIALGHNIGKAITDHDKHLVACAEDGYSEPFFKYCLAKNKNSSFADVAVSMTDKTKGYCFVRVRSDGKIIGDCEDCMKHLGYTCPAVNYVRSKYGQLEGGVNVLENGARVILNKKGKLRGVLKNTSMLYTGGLCSTEVKSKAPSEFQDDQMAYIESLTDEQAMEACLYLKLSDWCYRPNNKGNAVDRSVCIQMLQSFYKNPVEFRSSN